MHFTYKMNAVALAVLGTIIALSQAHATAPVPKNIGCPPDVPCANAGGSNDPTKKTPTAAAIPSTPSGPKITGITIGNADILDGKPLDITINGEGKACNYYLTITNTDTQDEWQLPKVSNFPSPDNISMALSNSNYVHGNYKLTAKAKPNDNRPGVSCLGGGNFVPFKKTRTKMTLAADAPKIVDVLVEPGKKMGGTDRYRNDELIRFNVVGSVENSENKDAAKQCGWTAQLVDANGVAKNIGVNSKFGVMQNSLPLTGLATGTYTLTVKTTAADDGLANQSCLGKATKKVEIFNVPGKVNGFSGLEAGSEENAFAGRHGGISYTADISGPTCMYKVTRTINNGSSFVTDVKQHIHVQGKAEPFVHDYYDDSKTIVLMTIEGFSNNYFEGGSCEGMVKKSIVVFSEKGKAAIVN